MKFLLSNFVALLLLTYCAALSTSRIEKIEDTLDVLEDEIESLAEKESKLNDDSANNVERSDEPSFGRNKIAKRQDGKSDYHCGFDGDCDNDFRINNTANIKWERKISFGIIIDRTSAGSGFMFAELNRVKDKQQKAFFNTGEFTLPSDENCASFYYYMYGHEMECDISRFLVYMECDGDSEPTELFRTSGNNYEDRKWRRVRVTVSKAQGTNCKVFWRVSRGLAHTHAYIAVDDISWKAGACPLKDGPEKPEFADCSFDSVNLCEWKASGAVPPSFSGGATRQKGTGPDSYFGYRSYPHGTRGHYVYLDSRDSKYIGKSLKLRSPLVRSAGKKCLKFALSMFGPNMGSVEAFLEFTDGTQEKVFSKSGHQPGKAYKWFDNSVTLPENKDYHIVLEATIGNGTKSDIAYDNILVVDGECPSGDAVLASCSFEGGKDCAYTNDVCPRNIEFKKLDVFKPRRYSLPLTILDRIAKEWSVSVDIKMLGTTRGWTNILHFTTGGNCCSRGQRIPAIFVWSNTYKLHITSAVGWNGNHQFNGATLDKDKWTNIKIQMKKATDGKYYYHVLVDGREKHKQRNDRPTEYTDVNVFAGDEWYATPNAELKNLIFTNGQFEYDCNPVCNKNVDDPAFVPGPPTKLTFADEQKPVKGKVLTTLQELQKEWRLSMAIKMKNKRSGWSNIIHATTGSNCCSRGQRLPAIFIWSNQYKSHICSQVGSYGNYNYNGITFVQNEYSNIVVEQKKINGKYTYQIIQDGEVKDSKEQTQPEVYKNMIYYLSDSWYHAPDAVVKNIVIENLVPSYPCPNLCKGKKNTGNVNGTEVNTFTYDDETCNKMPAKAQVNVPKHFRYGCARMMFKVAGNRCVIRLWNGGRHLHHFKTIKDGWNKVEWDLMENGTKVGLTADSIYSSCTEFTVSDIEVTEGLC